MIVVVFVVVALVGLLFTRTRLGLALRAAAVLRAASRLGSRGSVGVR